MTRMSRLVMALSLAVAGGGSAATTSWAAPAPCNLAAAAAYADNFGPRGSDAWLEAYERYCQNNPDD